MRVMAIALRLLFAFILSLKGSAALYAQQRYSQIVLSFPEERIFTSRFEPMDRAVVLEIQKTNPQELEALFHYDENIVRRVFFKDLGGQATEARLVLRDDSIKVMVHSFQEPFRITVDFFDADYREGVDPETGLPLVPLAQEPGMAAAPAPTVAEPTAAAPALLIPSGKRRFLQPEPSSIRTPQELVLKLNDTSGGIGQSWKSFPPYIYRLQTATLKAGKNYESWVKKNAGKALSSAEAMAQYAAQLFDFGHESRALVAYQRVLHDEPAVFDRNAEHIWKLAEIHLGQGSLTLADGYYESLQSKHPDHPLAAYAALRRLDIKAIRGTQEQKEGAIAALSSGLEAISSRDDPALAAQIALRSAYWQIPPAAIKGLFPSYGTLPLVNPHQASRLEEVRGGADSPRTAFLIDSLVIHHRLKQAAWSPELAKFAGEFFERYKGSATEPYRGQLLSACEKSMLDAVDKNLKKSDYAAVVAIIESLPQSMSELKKTADISWAAAESYRRLGQPLAALPYYETAAKTARNKPDQFRAAFWLMQSTMMALDNGAVKQGGRDQQDRLQKNLKIADKSSWESWQTLNPDEKHLLFAEVKTVVEQNIKDPYLIRTSPRILLEMWSEKLATDMPSQGNAISGKGDEAQPSARLIYVLADLSKRFEQLGLRAERKSATLLQRRINMKTVKADKEAITVWTKELTQLAEELRQSNDLLEAGRLYALTGSENNQWEGRAEALYKGGLLLFRSGRREEAMAALQQAASDGNNLLYAELAKKRLEQLQQ